jgi:superfamily II DNA/RNA helicase
MVQRLKNEKFKLKKLFMILKQEKYFWLTIIFCRTKHLKIQINIF